MPGPYMDLKSTPRRLKNYCNSYDCFCVCLRTVTIIIVKHLINISRYCYRDESSACYWKMKRLCYVHSLRFTVLLVIP